MQRLDPRVPLAALLAAGTLGVGVGCKKPPPPAPPPTTVLVAPAIKQDLALTAEAVGTLDGYVNAEIRARVKGFLKSQDYSDGAFVKTGQLLFTIDPAEYIAAVGQAKGALARAQAALGNARTSVERYKPLVAKQAVSQQDLDNALSLERAGLGAVQSAKAELDQAQLNLSYTRITSPVDGVAGTAAVRVGNLVGQDGPTLLTTVSQLDPMRVNFPISETDYLRFADRIRGLENLDPLDGGPERATLDLLLVDGSKYPHKGWVASVNRQVQSSTGTIQVESLFPNPERTLRPGQYARVRAPDPTSTSGKNVEVVPQSAVRELQGTYTVGVVGPGDVVQIRTVEVGPRSGNLWAITKGVAEGERVITQGLQKVTDGMKVTAALDPSVSQADAGAKP
jgi:membrane fusion protein (multidrug efflux system)